MVHKFFQSILAFFKPKSLFTPMNTEFGKINKLKFQKLNKFWKMNTSEYINKSENWKNLQWKQEKDKFSYHKLFYNIKKHKLLITRLGPSADKEHEYIALGLITSKNKPLTIYQGDDKRIINILKLGEHSPTGFQGIAQLIYIGRLKKGEYDILFSKLSDSDIEKYGGIIHLKFMLDIYCDSVNKGEYEAFKIFNLFLVA